MDNYIGKMDEQCIALCDAINKVPGIRTIESCCGHGERPYRIWFEADSLQALPFALYYFDGCHCGFYGWTVQATTDCGMSPVKFMVEGTVGDKAYEEANKIAALIEKNIDEAEDVEIEPGVKIESLQSKMINAVIELDKGNAEQAKGILWVGLNEDEEMSVEEAIDVLKEATCDEN